LAFPDYNHFPAVATQSPSDFQVALYISRKLSLPEFNATLGRVAELAPVMAVPKAAVNKYHSQVLWQHDVWPTEKLLPGIQAEAKSLSMENPPHRAFWGSVAALDLRHVPASTLFRQRVNKSPQPNSG
jgi:hypothetical protein